MSRPHPTQQPVRPPDCALAVGVPLTREQFLSDIANPDVKDYAFHFKRKNFLVGASDEFYFDLFEPSAKVARRVCDEVEAMGVTVRRDAHLNDLTDLLRKFKVVTLVTHWRFMRVLPGDIIDVHGLWRALASPEGRVQLAVAKEVSLNDPSLLATEPVATERQQVVRERLAAALTSVAAASHALYKSSDGTARPVEVGRPGGVLERLTRVELEQSFPGLIAFGKSVELSDRMYGVQEIVAGVPEGFSGLLDLTTCNSVILGKAIKARHPDCLVAVNRYETPLHVRMPLYKLVIQQLTQRDTSYADALARFHTN
jgi:hypothetical protein